jgi:glycosyltransferase involved in cell wall biosynthesis
VNDLRVLIVADQASLRMGGEAAIAIHMFEGLRAAGKKVWLVSHERNQDELQKRFRECQDRLFFFHDSWLQNNLYKLTRLLTKPLASGAIRALVRFSSYFGLLAVVRRVVNEHQISLVHQVMPVSPREPSPLFGLGVPVVIGPLNGNMIFPPGLRAADAKSLATSSSLLSFFTELANWLLPGKRQAKLILVASERARLALPRKCRAGAVQFNENGVDPAIWFSGKRTLGVSSPFRFIYSGRLMPWKGTRFLLDSFLGLLRENSGGEVTLEIVGDGPCFHELFDLACAEGVLSEERWQPGKIHFSGWMPVTDCAALSREADCFVLPSIWECGGAAMLEAMACGLPCIVANWGGPGELLPDSCGIKLPVSSEADLVNALTAAMARLAQNPELAQEMGTAALEESKKYYWPARIQQTCAFYNSAVNASTL